MKRRPWQLLQDLLVNTPNYTIQKERKKETNVARASLVVPDSREYISKSDNAILLSLIGERPMRMHKAADARETKVARALYLFIDYR